MIKAKTSYIIPPQFVDFKSEIFLSSLIDLILTASGKNADENGFGINDLRKLGATWVISRFAIEITQFPKENEKISIETWVEEIHTFNTIRNFRIVNEENEVLAEAISVWMMINKKTRRPMELQQLGAIHQFILPESTIVEKPMKLDNIEGIEVDSFKIKYSDIDINQHVNTRNYIRWMLDTFTLQELKEKKVQRLDINFISEILFGSEISVVKIELNQDEFRFDIRANNLTACKGRLLLKNRN